MESRVLKIQIKQLKMNFKKIEFEQKYPKIKWRVIRYATNYFDYEERDFDNECEERYLISGMRDTKDYFKPARVERKKLIYLL